MSQLDLGSLPDWLRSFEIELGQEQLDQSRAFLDALLLWNRKMNLVSQTRPDEIVTKHLAESFVAASLLDQHERVVDLGSGAGFPGIPCAIYRPGACVFLAEANQKKVSFLHEAVRLCRLPRSTVVGQRIEELSRRAEITGSMTAVIARALWKLDELLMAAGSLLAPGGRLIAMKGPNYRAELPSLDGSRFTLERVIPYDLADGSPRCLVVFCFT